MITKILSYAASLEDLLSDKLNEIGFTAETVDYNRALLPQLKDADVIVNGLGTVDKSIIDACPKLKLVHAHAGELLFYSMKFMINRNSCLSN